MYSAATSCPADGVTRPPRVSEARKERCPRSESALTASSARRPSSESRHGEGAMAIATAQESAATRARRREAAGPAMVLRSAIPYRITISILCARGRSSWGR